MHALNYQELQVGDLVWEVFPNTNFLQLGVVIGFSPKMVRIKREYNTALIKPKFLIKISYQTAQEHIQNLIENNQGQHDMKIVRCREVIELRNEMLGE